DDKARAKACRPWYTNSIVRSRMFSSEVRPMRPTFPFLQSIGQAVLQCVKGGLPVGDFVLEVLPDVARVAWEKLEQSHLTGAALRLELETLARAAASDVHTCTQTLAHDLASDRPTSHRQALASFLAQVPLCLRRSLRRPPDTAGITLPETLTPRKPNALVRLLPLRLPRFKPGDRPSGTDEWELVELLGLSAWGETWKARDPHRPHAAPAVLKFCLDPALAHQVRENAALLKQLEGSSVPDGFARVLDAYLHTEQLFLQYEFIRGGDLAAHLTERA